MFDRLSALEGEIKSVSGFHTLLDRLFAADWMAYAGTVGTFYNPDTRESFQKIV